MCTYQVILTFGGVQSCKVRVRLKLGVFSYPNVLNFWLEVSSKVWVRLKLGVLR